MEFNGPIVKLFLKSFLRMKKKPKIPWKRQHETREIQSLLFTIFECDSTMIQLFVLFSVFFFCILFCSTVIPIRRFSLKFVRHSVRFGSYFLQVVCIYLLSEFSPIWAIIYVNVHIHIHVQCSCSCSCSPLLIIERMKWKQQKQSIRHLRPEPKSHISCFIQL